MKKFLAILLALMMVAVGAIALADDPTGGETGDGGATGGETATPPITPGQPATAGTITIHKAITVNSDDGTATATDLTEPLTPAQTIEFTVGAGVATKANQDANVPVITIDDAVFGEGDTEVDININIGSDFNSTGIYTYTVTEVDNEVAGVNGNAAIDEMELKITVVQGEDGLELGGIALRQDGEKTDTIENTYEAGALTVKKLVTGNLGETDKDFAVTVKFTSERTVQSTISYESDATAAADKESGTIAPSAWSETNEASVVINLKADETVKFTNIPAGVTYQVVEDDYVTTDNYDDPEYTGEEGTIAAKTVSESTITNNKEIEIDTGIALDTAPYMMIMALVLGGFVLMISRRRREEY